MSLSPLLSDTQMFFGLDLLGSLSNSKSGGSISIELLHWIQRGVGVGFDIGLSRLADRAMNSTAVLVSANLVYMKEVSGPAAPYLILSPGVGAVSDSPRRRHLPLGAPDSEGGFAASIFREPATLRFLGTFDLGPGLAVQLTRTFTFRIEEKLRLVFDDDLRIQAAFQIAAGLAI